MMELSPASPRSHNSMIERSCFDAFTLIDSTTRKAIGEIVLFETPLSLSASSQKRKRRLAKSKYSDKASDVFARLSRSPGKNACV